VSYRSFIAMPGAALLALAAPLAAVLVVPDLSPQVVERARADLASAPGFVRAAGLTLPALVLTVPPAAVMARRLPARAVLLAGLLCLLGGIAAVRYAGTVPLLAGGRLLQGVGAGIVLPATAVLVWEMRSRFLVALWAGALAAGLVVAMPLALHLVPASGDWRVALAPFPWPVVLALAALLPCLAWRGEPLPVPKHAERGQVVLPIAPAAGLAFLALVVTHQWSPGAQLVVACIALVALCGPAMAAGRDAAAGSPLGCAVVMVATGLLAYPLAAPLAGLAADGGEMPPVPFAAGGAAALAGALLTAWLPGRAVRAAVPAGHALILAAVLVALVTRTPAEPGPLMAVLIPLGLGVGVALAASLRDAAAGAVLFGLGLCFPAVLTGQLLVLSLQAGRWQQARPATGAQQAQALADGYHVWLMAAGAIAVLLALAARPRPGGGAGKALPEPAAG
jgi:cyanate permease